VADSCENGNEPSGIIKEGRGDSGLSEQLLHSEEGLCSVELVWSFSETLGSFY
jgi:hypothetical protein